ncbi:MAG TPA: hypothetical protein DCL54_02140 [Alphaproteobacteria bacterium]|nr:hypothetical protein [Alphaproteobacteria bacterium]
MDKALRALVRDVLGHAARQGLMGNHHFLITFATNAPGVQISRNLADRYPEEMTIVLQHKFWGLQADENGFQVTLTFNKVPEELVIPFDAILKFADPSQDFGFALKPSDNVAQPKPSKDVPPAPTTHAQEPDSVGGLAAQPAPTVVSLDAFRKK